MIPTRGASTSIPSNACSTSGIGSSSSGSTWLVAVPRCGLECLHPPPLSLLRRERCRVTRSISDVAPVLRAFEADPLDRRVGARRAPLRGVEPRPVTFSTRPPAVTMPPSRRAVPAWVISTSCVALGLVEAADRRHPCSTTPGSPPRPSRPSPPSRRTTRARSSPSPPAHDTRSSVSRRSLRSRGSTACVSGSPKRQLNSSTFGPVGRQHQAGIEDAAVGRAAPRERVDDRAGERVSTISAQRSASMPGTGEKLPIPPVFGPSSPSPIRL